VFRVRVVKVCCISVAIALALAAALSLPHFKKNANGASSSADIPPLETETAASGGSFLCFKMEEFPWNQKLREDGSPMDFDLFTCPSAYLENGKIVLRPYDMLIADDTLPLYLSEIRRKPYRLVVNGYTRSTNGVSIVMFRDIETNSYWECEVNGKNSAIKIQVKEFELREYERKGVLCEVPVVRVYDELKKREFVLSDEQQYVDGEYVVVIRDTAGNSYAFSEPNGSMKIGDAICTLRSFDPLEGTAKLLLKDANGNEFRKTVHLIR
jgi:hypothetical protein